MSIYKRGPHYWYKFMHAGDLIRESTGQGNDRKARQLEAKHRTRLANQRDAKEEAQRRLKCDDVVLCDQCDKWGKAEDAHKRGGHNFCTNQCMTEWVKKHRKVPTLAEFLEDDFKPHVKVEHAEKPKTRDYYNYGVELLLTAGMGDLLLNEINSKHATGYIAKKSELSPSTVNCGLRTLRRALNLAEKWGKLDRAPELTLAKGEKKRERIVTLADFLAYRELCRQPWKDVATVLYGTAMRPGEVYALRWEHVLLNGSGGLIQIVEGKTKAAKRFLPMVAEVYITLTTRHADQKTPKMGWVFPAGSESGHLEESSAKHLHREAVEKLESASRALHEWAKQGSSGDWVAVVSAASKLAPEYLQRHAGSIQDGWKGFEPYCLRHSALTNLAASGCDAFTLARIAGHSSIQVTERYIHPQADAIERAFQSLADGHNSPEGGHNFRHTAKLPKNAESGASSVSD